MNDYMVRGTAHDGGARVFAISARGVVEQLRRAQGSDPAVTAALGRTALGALLLGAMSKEEEQLVTLRIEGGGPAGVVLASATPGGEVRALVGDPRPDIEQVREGKLNVSGAVGSSGRLTVTRDLGLRQPYTSTVELASGEIGEDLAYYFAASEQVPSAVGIGVFVRPDGSVEAAGGYLVQLLPGLEDEIAGDLERSIRELPHPTTLLRSGDTPEDILRRLFGAGLELEAPIPVRHHCPCSVERAERALVLLGAGELEDVREQHEQEGSTELVCQFCGESYSLSLERIDRLIERAQG